MLDPKRHADAALARDLDLDDQPQARGGLRGQRPRAAEAVNASASVKGLLESYCELLLRFVDGQAASLCLAGMDGHGRRPLLVHQGTGPPLPELADPAAAAEFVAHAAATPPWSSVGSRVPSGRLLRLPLTGSESLANPALGTPRPDLADPAAPAVWAGLRFAQPRSHESMLRIAGGSSPDLLWSRLLSFGGAIAQHSSLLADLLQSPVTGLPDRLQFERAAHRCVQRAAKLAAPLSLLLVSPDNFEETNEQLGRQAADRVLRQIARQILVSKPGHGSAYHFGAASFALLLHDTGEAEARSIADQLVLDLTERLSTPEVEPGQLGFSIGVSTFFSPPEEPPANDPRDRSTQLVLQADQALGQAKRLGGRRAVRSQDLLNPASAAPQDRLSGIFTADGSRDYRNMLLLWDTISVVSSTSELDELLSRVASRLLKRFRADFAVAYRCDDPAAEPVILGGAAREAGRSLAADHQERALIRQARAERCAVEASWKATAEGEEIRALAVPLLATGSWIGCLLLAGRAEALEIGTGERTLLEALANQLGAAVERADLIANERRLRVQQQRQLQTEVDELRWSLSRQEMIYQSPQIERLLGIARRVAPTDVTVLVSGQSGTGKGLLAHAVHDLSLRRGQPPVVVDCSAIAATLIESELFGHERGSFTGAEQRVQGRLVDADGGSVILDEIGELPLEVQSKLLRFVQQKELTPVGGRKVLHVDARVIAVTNRNLAAEVKAGRFREDLYHRLNVVHLEVPPLSERREDIMLLARRFLERFAHRHRKPALRLAPEAEVALLSYGWPGNVRELENRILQAVILCDEEVLGSEHLRLGNQRMPDPGVTSNSESGEGLWSSLQLQLRGAIRTAIDSAKDNPAPLGSWLAADLILAASARSGGNVGQGAALLGIPKTTYRRRLRKAEGQVATGQSFRHDGWQSVRATIGEVLDELETAEVNLLTRARTLLLHEVFTIFPRRSSIGAALMGVTEPTYRRWSRGL